MGLHGAIIEEVVISWRFSLFVEMKTKIKICGFETPPRAIQHLGDFV
jgi:hypothetical protein